MTIWRMIGLGIMTVFVFGACSQPLGEDDLKCETNEDCKILYGCDPNGDCLAFVHDKPVVIITETLKPALIGDDYWDTVSAEGGLLPYSWSATFTDKNDSGVTIDWLTIVADAGRVESSGPVPLSVPEEISAVISVHDSSNAGEGDLDSETFIIKVNECAEDKVYSYQPQDGACWFGWRACVDGKISGDWTADSKSSDVNNCGPACASCDLQKANLCVECICMCAAEAACDAARACCDSGCKDLTSDLNFCGSCTTDCEVTVVGAVGLSCLAGACQYTSCTDGNYDCNSDESDGCEVAAGDTNCLACDDDCTNPNLYIHAATAACDLGGADPVCLITCADSFGDCQTDDIQTPATLGCETAIDTATNCGGCSDDNPALDCADSFNGNACIDDGLGGLTCGCVTVDNCDIATDQLCCGVIAACVPRSADHCTACFEGCTILNGGPSCVEINEGEYECQCVDDIDCKGGYDFSEAECPPSNLCNCQGAISCAGTVDDMCCYIDASNKGCVDLNTDEINCGVCNIDCAKIGDGACDADQACTDGVCGCSINCVCPDDSGAPDCAIEGVCVCFAYDGEPCPIGTYCCPGQGCCKEVCGTPSPTCCEPPKEWCASGECCDSSEPDIGCL